MKLVEVWKASNEIEAQLIRGLLEANGIDCTLKGEALRLTHSITVNGLAQVTVLVRPGDAETARQLIASSHFESTRSDDSE